MSPTNHYEFGIELLFSQHFITFVMHLNLLVNFLYSMFYVERGWWKDSRGEDRAAHRSAPSDPKVREGKSRAEDSKF